MYKSGQGLFQCHGGAICAGFVIILVHQLSWIQCQDPDSAGVAARDCETVGPVSAP